MRYRRTYVPKNTSDESIIELGKHVVVYFYRSESQIRLAYVTSYFIGFQ